MVNRTTVKNYLNRLNETVSDDELRHAYVKLLKELLTVRTEYFDISRRLFSDGYITEGTMRLATSESISVERAQVIPDAIDLRRFGNCLIVTETTNLLISDIDNTRKHIKPILEALLTDEGGHHVQ